MSVTLRSHETEQVDETPVVSALKNAERSNPKRLESED